MTYKLDKGRLKNLCGAIWRIAMVCGAVVGTGLAVKSCHDKDVHENESTAAVEKAANDANSFNETLRTGFVDQTEYSILGKDTIRITEGDVSYRYNLASQIITMRYTKIDDAQRTDNLAAISFNQQANPAYIQNITSTACDIALRMAPKAMQVSNLKLYSADWQSGIRTTYATVRKFGELHCGVKP